MVKNSLCGGQITLFRELRDQWGFTIIPAETAGTLSNKENKINCNYIVETYMYMQGV